MTDDKARRELTKAISEMGKGGYIGPIDTSDVGILTDYQKQAYHALGKIKSECEKLLFDNRIGAVSRIDVPVQDVGEYELVLTLKLKK